MEFELEFPAELDQMPGVIEQALALASAIGCDDERMGQLELAMQEGLANAIVHGSKNDATKKVYCAGTVDERGLLVVIRDSGPGFNPDTVPHPKDGDNIFRNHGRGIFMIRELVDEVEYALNGAELRMRMLRSAAATAAEGNSAGH